MDQDYNYFVAAGPSLDAVRQWQLERKAVSAQIEAVRERVGAEAAVNRRTLVGFTFAGDVPAGWARAGEVEGKSYFAPTRRSQAGKALRQEMGALRPPGVEAFARLIGLGPYVGADYVLRYVTFAILVDTTVIRVPADTGGSRKVTPEGGTPLKLSEYLAMKSRHVAAKEAAHAEAQS